MNNLLKAAIAIILLLQGALSAQELRKENGRYSYKHVQTFDVVEEGRLHIQRLSADVSIAGWDKRQVEVAETAEMRVYTEAEAQSLLENSPISIDAGRHIITLRARSGFGDRWLNRSLTIRVPHGFEMDLALMTGDLAVSGIRADIDIATTNGDIDISDITGRIDLRTSNGDLTIEKVIGAIEARTSNGEIVIRNLDGEADVRTSAGSVDVINSTGTINLQTSGGSIRVENAAGAVSARTSGGDIDALRCASGADLQTSGGDIEMVEMAGIVDAGTSGGDIEGEKINGVLTVETHGGDIQLTEVAGSVRAATYAGDVDVEITLDDYQVDHRMWLISRSGSIYLHLPADLPASINAVILGRGRWHRYDIFSDFPLKKIAPEQQRNLQMGGEINGGGDEINLETTNGDIRILKR